MVKSWFNEETDRLDNQTRRAIQDYTLRRLARAHRGGAVKSQTLHLNDADSPRIVTEYVHASPLPANGDAVALGVEVHENVLTPAEIDAAEESISRLAQRALRDEWKEPFVVNSSRGAGRLKIFFGFAYERVRQDSQIRRLICDVPSIYDELAEPLHDLACKLQARGLFPSGFIPNQYVLNVYERASSYLLAHKDASHLFDGPIFTVRLFRPRVLAFAPDGHMCMNLDRGVVNVPQSIGSVTKMSGFAKESLQHCVPRVEIDDAQKSFSAPQSCSAWRNPRR